MAEYFVPKWPVETGKMYYTVKCPKTFKPLLFEEDQSWGETPYPAGPLFVSCSYCQETHEIPEPTVVSVLAK